jgi:hypothetical protein
MEVSGQLYARPLYLQRKSPWYPTDRRLSGPQSCSGRSGFPIWILTWNISAQSSGIAETYTSSASLVQKNVARKVYKGWRGKARIWTSEDRVGWSTSRSGRFTPGNHDIGDSVESRGGQEVIAKRKIPASSVNPVLKQPLYLLSYPSSYALSTILI